MSPRYDTAGNEYAAEDVLDAEELSDYYAARRIRGHRVSAPSLRIFPGVDRDGVDSDGFEHGARNYGSAS